MSNPYTAQHAHESTSNALIRNSIVISAALAVFGIVFAAIGGLVALWVAGADFAKWTAVTIIGGFALAIASLLVKGWENARWVLVETIAANITKVNAEASRIEAEANAISGAGNVNIQTVNAGEGAKVKAQLQAGPRVRLASGNTLTWNQLNQLEQVQPAPRRLEFPRSDVLWMLEQFVNVKHSKRPFIGQELPNSRLPAYPELYNELIRVLVEGQAIQGRNDRTSGRLVTKDVSDLVKIIDAQHPQGVTLELSPTLSETEN